MDDNIPNLNKILTSEDGERYMGQIFRNTYPSDSAHEPRPDYKNVLSQFIKGLDKFIKENELQCSNAREIQKLAKLVLNKTL